MLVAMLDMLAGVFLRYVMTQLTARFDLPRVDFFWVEEEIDAGQVEARPASISSGWRKSASTRSAG